MQRLHLQQAGIFVAAGVACLLIAVTAHASNGMNMIGFGAESMGMGGADLAIAADTSAMNTNPAGLAQIQGKRADLYAAALFAINVRHRDAFGNNRGVDNSPIPLAFAFDINLPSGLASAPKACLPDSAASRRTVPEPENGSRTLLPSCDNRSFDKK